MGINVPSPRVHERNLAKRSSPMLSDGMALGDLIDFDKREVKMRVLADPEIHAMELKRVFSRAWIIVGHVSEIPNAGDYVKRYIGQDQVIVVRARDGSVNILLNACAHRGMEVCWADEGNQASFKCPYHGWVFDHTGKLMGAPFEKEMYGDWDKSQYGLRKAHVAVRHGVIFGAFNPMGDLDDWFGEFGWYFDVMYGSAEMEAIGPGAFGHQIAANWKAAGEQNCGDGYHTVTLHHCLNELGFQSATNVETWSLDCHDISSYEGHGLRCVEVAHSVMKTQPKAEDFPVGWFVAGAMFPAVNVGGSASRGGGAGLVGPAARANKVVYSANIGAMSPRGLSSYNQWRLTLVEKDLDPTVKNTIRQSFASAVIVADDQEAWPSMTRVAQGSIGAEQPIRYNAILGPNKPADWPGPALVHRGVSKDDNQWHFWMRWYDMMTTE